MIKIWITSDFELILFLNGFIIANIGHAIVNEQFNHNVLIIRKFISEYTGCLRFSGPTVPIKNDPVHITFFFLIIVYKIR